MFSVKCLSVHVLAMSVLLYSHQSNFGRSSVNDVTAAPDVRSTYVSRHLVQFLFIRSVYLMVAYLQGLCLLRSTPRRV